MSIGRSARKNRCGTGCGEISIPVLWIAGENDPKFLALAERAVSLIPNAHLAIAPGAGHRVPWEAEAWFAETVRGFLQLGRIRQIADESGS